ncbi:hypothetical protein M569_02406 [Genlisea aurea]|uniref:Signal recognition particle subunit SRP72 n=1 Tax=Genlisea aurea TaxID=192259 RepID=S8D4T9_9LAMI|nr:hypothetical protein M569_02406 [Genlisea aurea]
MAPKAKEKSKPPPPQASPEVSVAELFTNLNRHIQRSEFGSAVRVSDQILSIAPGDEDAMKCKIVALIRNDDMNGALTAIKEFAKKSSVDFSFYTAYCLYRQNQLDEALGLLKGQEERTASLLLQSQILYRLGKTDESAHIYQRIQKSKTESLEINLVAALVSAGRSSEVQGTIDSLRVKPSSSFELSYNVACSLVERQKYKDAEQLLLSARRIGQETLMEENLPDDDIEIELAPIAVQIAYVQQILGNVSEATESYSNIIKKNLADESSIAVSVNNLIVLKGPKDVSDGLRKLDKLIEKGDGLHPFRLARGLDLKLSQKQREAIYVNRLLLLLHSNKLDQARELASALPGIFPGSVMPVLLQAAVHVRENKANKAEDILLQFANKSPECSKIVLLARAQVAAASGHLQIAAESLLRIPDIQHLPATVATLVALKERAGDFDGADSVFDSSIRWWSDAMTEDSKLGVIMQEAASFKLKHGKRDEASRLYEELVKSSRGSVGALTGLVQTAALTDIEKAESYEKQLKPLPGLKAINAEILEKTSGPKQAENDDTVGISDAYEASKTSKEKTRKKRKRKPRYPKGFDPANPGPPPDPERWLPKRERSTYRPKRKDKRAAQVRGSQGAVAKEANQTANSKTTSQAAAAAATTSSKSRKKSRK